MKAFQLTRPKDSAQAIATTGKTKTAQQGADIRFIAGGTTLIDLMKLNVDQPQNLVDVNRLPLDKIEATPDGGLTIGATVRNSELAWHPLVRKNYRVLSEAILSGATVQIRNMATLPATCCSGRVACISATPRCRVISASLAPVAARSMASIGTSRSSARASNASRRIHPT